MKLVWPKIAVAFLVIGVLLLGGLGCAELQGAQGPPGPQGVQGVQGPAGSQGLRGPAGEDFDYSQYERMVNNLEDDVSDLQYEVRNCDCDCDYILDCIADCAISYSTDNQSADFVNCIRHCP